MSTIQERIKELIDTEGLTNSEFAQQIDINPSIVSHILSGRNKVSLHVVEQVKVSFTNVNLDYIITGAGQLYQSFTNVNTEKSNVDKQQLKEVNPTQAKPIIKEEERSPIPVNIEEKQVESIPSPAPSINIKKENMSTDTIDQIIVFYGDGSFKQYSPRKD